MEPGETIPTKRSRWWGLRITLNVLLALLILGGSAVLWVLHDFRSQLIRVEPGPESTFGWPYYLFVPRELDDGDGASSTRLVLPNNTGRNSDNFEVHAKSSWHRARRESRLARSLGVPTLVPIFSRPATDWRVYTHALDRDCLTTKLPRLVRATPPTPRGPRCRRGSGASPLPIHRAALERWTVAARIYQEAGSRAELRLYPGVGHCTTSEMARDVREFLARALEGVR